MNRREAVNRLSYVGLTSLAAFGIVKAVLTFRDPGENLKSIDTPLVDYLAETIIPRTSTPGAIDAGVGSFIILMVTDCANRQTKNRFLIGLQDVEHYAGKHYSKNFVSCNQKEREQILSFFEKKGMPLAGTAGKVQRRLFGDSFFVTLKKYTVLGYCTSKIGATEALVTDYVPGSYVNTKLQPGQRAWAIQ